ncbi:MAG: Gfo/Idh/MocA family oxidoreductase [Acidobacteriaceae bacterium]|nr:Gfo/Idh/MocA family oxidoreductase [Acidobacteriaceae bacterium]MBV9295693.1 Gfo/Idh/MocA family oxidoreductase [Acidobacteriaceae bacterium]MBV9765898.1 Gfo/Idh/MocA family oxidoreductase [Acidobacteriaceae bacterium]
MNITRRNFTYTVAGASALYPFNRIGIALARQDQERKLRYCIVGLGRIAMGHFMPACKMSQKSQVIAFVSGHRDKAEKMAAEYNVPAKNIYSYANYDEIASNKDIDAVYIALPNSMHAEYSIRAAKAGKHVLCEKPMATSLPDSQAIVDACKAAGKKLMIAYRCQYEPTNLRAIQMIHEGQLGTIQAIESANGFNERPGEWRLEKKLAGGGPLMDVGIYSLNACRYLTGENPVHVEGYCSVIDQDGRFKEVEENVSWNMTFPSGVVASCNTTYGADMPGFFRVHGSKGMIHMQPAFAYEGLHLKADIQGQPPIDEPNHQKDPYEFVLEADDFADCVFQNKEPKANGEEGLRDMQYMAQIYGSCGRTM